MFSNSSIYYYLHMIFFNKWVYLNFIYLICQRELVFLSLESKLLLLPFGMNLIFFYSDICIYYFSNFWIYLEFIRMNNGYYWTGFAYYLWLLHFAFFFLQKIYQIIFQSCFNKKAKECNYINCFGEYLYTMILNSFFFDNLFN